MMNVHKMSSFYFETVTKTEILKYKSIQTNLRSVGSVYLIDTKTTLG